MLPTPVKTVYVSKVEYLSELLTELHEPQAMTIDNLVLSTQEPKALCFALDIWTTPQLISFHSVSEATRLLKQAGRFWFHHPISHVRRGELIAGELRKLPALQHAFPITEKLPPIGCYSLLDQNTLLYSAQRFKNPPLGNFKFIEDKMNPPNRAYLKLWEALSLCDAYPRAPETALDLGASPGGWTYVMQSLGTTVTAIDKALLDFKIAQLPRVQYLQHSAFAFEPQAIDQPFDWVLCDVACYPERTLNLAKLWIDSHKAKRLIFTIKLQGETNLPIIQKFQAISGGSVHHLYHNKHEATFFWQ